MPVTRVAVLPFGTPAELNEEDLALEGLRDAVASELSALEHMRVIAAASASRSAAEGGDVREIARRLGAELVVDGSMVSRKPKPRVHLRLTSASGAGRPTWERDFDADLRTAGAVGFEVTRAVLQQLCVARARSGETRVAREATSSDEAFRNYVRARHFWTKRTEADIQRAVLLLKAALDADPAYAPAYAGLADCYNQLATVGIGQPPTVNRERAIAAASKAIALDDQNPQAHAALGFAKLYNWDWAGAQAELARAVQLNPSYASARVWRASSLLIRRHFDEAVVEVDRAGELDPLSPITQTQAGWIRMHAGRWEEAVAQFRKVLETDPDYPWAIWQLAEVLVLLGRPAEAIPLAQRACSLANDNPAFLGVLGSAYAKSGQSGRAREILQRLRAMAKQRYVTPHAIGEVCLELGDRECFFESLEEGYRQRTNYMAYLSVTPSERNHAGVRADPRFQDLIRRLGYPPTDVLSNTK